MYVCVCVCVFFFFFPFWFKLYFNIFFIAFSFYSKDHDANKNAVLLSKKNHRKRKL